MIAQFLLFDFVFLSLVLLVILNSYCVLFVCFSRKLEPVIFDYESFNNNMPWFSEKFNIDRGQKTNVDFRQVIHVSIQSNQESFNHKTAFLSMSQPIIVEQSEITWINYRVSHDVVHWQICHAAHALSRRLFFHFCTIARQSSIQNRAHVWNWQHKNVRKSKIVNNWNTYGL